MRRNQKTKTIAIIVLCISVLGLTLGFAAFSNTLTISSSATVSPDAGDFKLVVYGVPSLPDYDQSENFYNVSFTAAQQLVGPVTNFTSTTTTKPVITTSPTVADLPLTAVKDAVIENKGNGTISIKNISATYTEPDQGAYYFFVIKNEGYYDAYINIMNLPEPTKTCTPEPGTTAAYVEDACTALKYTRMMAMPEADGTYNPDNIINFVDERGNVKIPVGGYAYIILKINYSGYNENTGLLAQRADGPFSATWSDLTFTFTTNAQ